MRTIATTTGAGPATIGLLVASFPGALPAGIAVAGARLRRTPPATMLLAAMAPLGLGCAGFTLGHGLLGYAVARAVMGLGSGGLWMAITFATLRRWPSRAYPRMSRILAAYPVGGLLGPALGATGALLDTVAPERIVTAMVVWSVGRCTTGTPDGLAW